MLLNKYHMNNIIVGDIIGSGSLAQVYHCNIPGNNEKLVLKVKHPGVNQLKYEISAVKMILRLLSCFKRYQLVVNVDWDEFFTHIEKQIDFTNEKRYIEKYYDIYQEKIPEIRTPRYIDGNSDFIVMTFCSGKPLNTFPKESITYKRAHNLFFASSVHTFFVHQITHGDVHEGNILVNDDGTINIIDFGICIEYNDKQNEGIMTITKFMSEPVMENCLLCIKSLLKPHNIYGKEIDFVKFAHEGLEAYKEKYGDFRPINMINFFDLLATYLQKYDILIRANILSYIFNQMLLEGLSPYNEKADMSVFVTITYMKQHPFFIEEVDFFLDEYYDELNRNISKELTEKYKNIDLLKIEN